MKILNRYLFVALLLLAILAACDKENVISNQDVTLDFSTDTIMFDTVFTQIGSTTQRFTVTNPENGTITIDEIKVAGGDDSNYRLNVNGYQGNEIENIELRAKDSIFIFVEVTVDPTNANSPVVIEDSIMFTINQSQQNVKLVAFGQDYHLISEKQLYKGYYLFDTTWTADKPWLIYINNYYNSLFVDTNSTLTIEEGCQIHLHHQNSIYVIGTLEVNGTKENPVVFQGDRLEHMYDDVPGQWGHIRMLPGSRNNVIDHAIIKNGIIGVQVDSVVTSAPTLRISNTVIENMNSVGLYALGGNIQASNCVFGNCGQYSVTLAYGGKYQFFHCTIGNYWSYANRVTPALIINNWYEDVNENIHIRPIENAYFSNCVIYGNRDSEVGLDMYEYSTEESFNYHFEHCLLKIDTVLPDDRQLNCIVDLNPNFLDPYNGKFELDTLSGAKDMADYNTAQFYPEDILGTNRLADGRPDIGAYERVE